MNVCPRTQHPQLGLTLLELLIAMSLGVFLLAGVTQSFLSARQTYRVQEGLSRIIENGRYAIEFIDRDVRMAGYRGCNGSLSLAGANNHLTSPTSFENDFETSFQGFEASSTAWTPTIDPTIIEPEPGSDIITVRRADETGHSVTAHTSTSGDITLANTTGLEVGDKVLIADCNNADVFQISNLSGTDITPNATLSATYPPPLSHAEVYPITTTSYYIRTRTDQPVASLYRKIGTSDAEELIEGVEGLQIEYGVDTDLDAATGISPDYTANYYVAANDVPDMNLDGKPDFNQVVSVRIRLLVATPNDNVTAEPQAYSFAGTDYDAPDNRIRHEFTSTIALRNRIK